VVKTWCIPPKANAEFVWRREDVLEVYRRPYDSAFPVVCVDESSKQLLGEVAQPIPASPGQPARMDYEYERLGVCNLFLLCEPLRGWRHVKVTSRRTRQDWAGCMQELVDVHFPTARKVLVVEDNLSTHDGASLYETFPPEAARRILERLEFHSTPKHGSWLDMAETELSVLNGQCLNRRIESAAEVAREVATWEADRNQKRIQVHWCFTISAARNKLKKLYPDTTANNDEPLQDNQNPSKSS
jgi:hypothetical protein